MFFTSLKRSGNLLALLSIICCLSSLFFSPTTHKTITIITSIQQAQATFDQATADDLFVFDVDQTLLGGGDPTFHPRNYLPPQDLPFPLYASGVPTKATLELRPLLQAFFKELSTHEALRYHLTKQIRAYGAHPVERKMIELIKNLRARGIRVLCLTGRARVDTSYIKEDLTSLGADVFSSFPGTGDIDFANLPLDPKKIPGGYFDNILFSAAKGPALAKFLEQINYRPARVFFFDDFEHLTKSIAIAMLKLGIPSQSFVYLADWINQIQLDPALVKAQLTYILEHEEYINYDDAKKLFIHA